MWAYVATYEMPNDDPEALERARARRLSRAVDRCIGRGKTPTLRLQRALGTPGHFRRWEKALVWSHWLWFLFPHGTVLYLLLRQRDRFPRTARRRSTRPSTSALIGYWAIPTAPPWYAARAGRWTTGAPPELRRMMVEYGEQFWGSGWEPLYGVLGGNPLAAMPSLHFATSVMAAHCSPRRAPSPGARLGLRRHARASRSSTSASTTSSTWPPGSRSPRAIRPARPLLTPAFRRVSRAVQALEAQARA